MTIRITRRRLLATAAAGTVGALATSFLAGIPAARAASPVLLVIGRRTLDVNGKPASVFGITQSNGTHGLITSVDKPFRVHLENDSGDKTLIHWHGLTPPYQQDGVPYVSGPPIEPGASASYDFPLRFSGTYWMHSHQGLQEQQLMSAPLIIHDGSTDRDEQEVVVMLHDFSFKSPQEIFASLRHTASSKPDHQMPGMNMGSGDRVPGMSHDMPGMGEGGMSGMKKSRSGDASPAGMTMDLNDVDYDAFLANDRSLADPQVVQVEPGGRVLLRIINGSAASNFYVDLGQVKAELVAVDGHAIQPISKSVFPIAIAQRLDLRLQLPRAQSAIPIFAVLEGERKRTGIVLATARGQVRRLAELASTATAPLDLQVEQGLHAAVPLPPKPPDRVHQVDLTGSMELYAWGLNGKAYEDSAPLLVSEGQRVELVMTNRTMMSHPMHLHGHAFQVVAIGGRRVGGAVRDTVLVPARTSVTIAFDADNPGKWVFHCHNLYHMQAGMMTTVQYETF
jgi:FtsP/CotA-like multicopper oxidase with cupredoxin domain